jgi:REP element-mobilizing transposase RayT
MIDGAIEEELFAYLGGICNRLECHVIKVGGYRNHVHVLCNLSKKLPLMKLMEELKGHSSKWIKTKGKAYKNFYWQGGYSAFSVYYREVDVVVRYIANQRTHHTKKTFEEEYITLLKEHDIPYDERYMWD